MKKKISDIFEFIKNDDRYNNLKLGNWWFKDIWFTLFEGKNIFKFYSLWARVYGQRL